MARLFSFFSFAPKAPKFEMQVLSDIHLEFDGPTQITPCAPYLALIGDIGVCNGRDRFLQLADFLKKLCAQYRNVFFVSGNHEFYHSSVSAVNQQMCQLQQEVDNFVYLDCNHFDVPETDIRILGCTMWSYLTERGGEMLNDLRLIAGMTVETYRGLHNAHVAYLEQQCAVASQQSKRVIVLTHHAPFVDGLVPNVSFGGELLNNGCLGTDLLGPGKRFSRQRFPALHTWAYGHTHLSKSFKTADGIQVVSNQTGYPHDITKTWLFTSAASWVSAYTNFDWNYKLSIDALAPPQPSPVG